MRERESPALLIFAAVFTLLCCAGVGVLMAMRMYVFALFWTVLVVVGAWNVGILYALWKNQ